MKIRIMIKKFLGDIYFEPSNNLRNDFIKICEELNIYLNNINVEKSKHEQIMNELFKVFETNDFIKMADYLEYDISRHLKID